MSSAAVDRLVELEAARKTKMQQVQEFNAQANAVSKSIGKAKDEAEREARKKEGRELRNQKDSAQAEHDRLDDEIQEIQLAIPNMAHPDCPIGER